MFVHPNQVRFVAGQIPGVQAVQGVVTRPDGRKDHFTVRVEVGHEVAEMAVADPLKQAIQNICRVRVDKLEFVPSGTLTANTPGMVDERDWS